MGRGGRTRFGASAATLLALPRPEPGRLPVTEPAPCCATVRRGNCVDHTARHHARTGCPKANSSSALSCSGADTAARDGRVPAHAADAVEATGCFGGGGGGGASSRAAGAPSEAGAAGDADTTGALALLCPSTLQARALTLRRQPAGALTARARARQGRSPSEHAREGGTASARTAWSSRPATRSPCLGVPCSGAAWRTLTSCTMSFSERTSTVRLSGVTLTSKPCRRPVANSCYSAQRSAAHGALQIQIDHEHRVALRGAELPAGQQITLC
jgi:hypothetical protein